MRAAAMVLLGSFVLSLAAAAAAAAAEQSLGSMLCVMQV
jgi:hypothetical protein